MITFISFYIIIGVLEAALFMLLLKKDNMFPKTDKDKTYLFGMLFMLIFLHPLYTIRGFRKAYCSEALDVIIDAEVIDDKRKKGKK
jgi:hypothetical protein